jgi:hypothetical protein
MLQDVMKSEIVVLFCAAMALFWSKRMESDVAFRPQSLGP